MTLDLQKSYDLDKEDCKSTMNILYGFDSSAISILLLQKYIGA